MRKFTLLLISMFVAFGAMAQKIEDFYDASTDFGTYSGPITNIIDGNTASIWWSNEAQAVDKTVTVVLKDAYAVETIKFFFDSSDQPTGAAIERKATADGEWINVANFTKDDIKNNVFTCNAEGEKVKELRFRITAAHTNWLKIAEIELYAPITEREISVEALGEGIVSIVGAEGSKISTNEAVTMEGTPADGYYLSYWKVGDKIVGKGKSVVDESNENKTYVAVFEEVPEWTNDIYRLRCKGDNNYLTVVKKNVTYEEQSYQTTAEDKESEDQIFKFEPDGYGCYYLKSVSGYYLNCASWNAFAEDNQATTPLTVSEPDVDGFVSLFQATSSYPGYLEIQAKNNNGLYCNAAYVSGYTLWALEPASVSTAIEAVEVKEEITDVIFDIVGRRIEKITVPGVYVINGRKVLVK